MASAVYRQKSEAESYLEFTTLDCPLPGPQESRELEEVSLCHGGQSEGPDFAQQGRAEGDR